MICYTTFTSCTNLANLHCTTLVSEEIIKEAIAKIKSRTNNILTQIDADSTLPTPTKFGIRTELTRSMQNALDLVPEYKCHIPCYPGGADYGAGTVRPADL